MPESDCFSLKITCCEERSWKGTKYRGESAILWATGQDLRRLLIRWQSEGQRGEWDVSVPEQIDLRAKMGLTGVYRHLAPEYGLVHRRFITHRPYEYYFS